MTFLDTTVAMPFPTFAGALTRFKKTQLLRLLIERRPLAAASYAPTGRHCRSFYTSFVCRPAFLAAEICLLSEETNNSVSHSSAQAICKASAARTGLDSKIFVQ